MAVIDYSFIDVSGKNGKSFINLNPDRELNLNNMKPPVIWSGYLNNTPISLKWIGNSFDNKNNYEILNLPKEVSSYLGEILKCIDEHYKYLD